MVRSEKSHFPSGQQKIHAEELCEVGVLTFENQDPSEGDPM